MWYLITKIRKEDEVGVLENYHYSGVILSARGEEESNGGKGEEKATKVREYTKSLTKLSNNMFMRNMGDGMKGNVSNVDQHKN